MNFRERTMTFMDAVRSAKLGLKIRSVNWPKHRFIYLDNEDDEDNDFCWFDEQGDDAFLPDYEKLLCPWEIYPVEKDLIIGLGHFIEEEPSFDYIERDLLTRMEKICDPENGYVVDKRWLAIAKTDMEKAFMALRRALEEKDL
jgi:hypothetical protein